MNSIRIRQKKTAEVDEAGAQLAHFSGKMIKDTEEEQRAMAKAHMARQRECKLHSLAQRLRQ
jgi:hypothetical protein